QSINLLTNGACQFHSSLNCRPFIGNRSLGPDNNVGRRQVRIWKEDASDGEFQSNRAKMRREGRLGPEREDSLDRDCSSIEAEIRQHHPQLVLAQASDEVAASQASLNSGS